MLRQTAVPAFVLRQAAWEEECHVKMREMWSVISSFELEMRPWERGWGERDRNIVGAKDMLMHTCSLIY